MQIQLTRKRIINTLLIGTMTLTIASLNIQPAQAQLNRSAFREMSRELNLSRSEMREIAGIMRNFKSEVQEILTPEQFEQLQSAREQQPSQPPTQDPQEVQEALNLTDDQLTQLAEIREEMVVALQAVLTPEQLERMMETIALSQF